MNAPVADAEWAEHAARFQLEAMPFDPRREMELCGELGSQVLAPGFPGYPPLLEVIADPPAVLYVRGAPEFSACPALAIVGSRRPTPYGCRMARKLAQECARAGIAVVSGLARGIDAEAHRAALEAGGKTWGVLGSGLDRPYPPENRELMREMASSDGAVMTEVPFSGVPVPANFPRRNRIISGLSWAVVVVEGDIHSGSLITARTALDQGREVFAVPGPADSRMSEGPHLLLRNGAAVASGLSDILEIVPALRSAAGPLRESSGRFGTPPTRDEEKILELFGSEPKTFDELHQAAGSEAGRLARILTEMEMKGLIDAYSGQRYARR